MFHINISFKRNLKYNGEVINNTKAFVYFPKYFGQNMSVNQLLDENQNIDEKFRFCFVSKIEFLHV